MAEGHHALVNSKRWPPCLAVHFTVPRKPFAPELTAVAQQGTNADHPQATGEEACRAKGPQARRSAPENRRPPERDLQQREFLEHRYRRQRRHPDLQRRRRTNARLHRRRRHQQDDSRRHFRSGGDHRARRGRSSAEASAPRSRRASKRSSSRQVPRDRGHL